MFLEKCLLNVCPVPGTPVELRILQRAKATRIVWSCRLHSDGNTLVHPIPETSLVSPYSMVSATGIS